MWLLAQTTRGAALWGLRLPAPSWAAFRHGNVLNLVVSVGFRALLAVEVWCARALRLLWSVWIVAKHALGLFSKPVLLLLVLCGLRLWIGS